MRRWPSPFGAAKDRNKIEEESKDVDAAWRSPSGAAEDRNTHTPGENEEVAYT
ncbi:hypothetical protein P6B95_02465 [Streptomyces atratus]|uniref:hypothetical protein n=1 Tax=Streptomyces atratus TaxID=1893 RepID=UPI00166FFE00|nr:hypothetical protein [Streptomyces atratus]WPW26430.1 hypothetical protein P6B95_02465 [Streptomyces atratus]GGT74954.1 hypothetical protein GCM10010207_85320 [Streptomyces atratus]